MLRDGNAECVFCGGGALTPDAPCDCEGAVEEREILKIIGFTKKKIIRLFRDSEKYQEKISEEALKYLQDQVEPLARRICRKAIIDIGLWNKATLRRNKGVISVKRTEKLEEEADDEEEIEE